MAHWFETAVGGLGWSPAAFWGSSIGEFIAAVEGHNRANSTKPEPLTMEELDALIEEYPD